MLIELKTYAFQCDICSGWSESVQARHEWEANPPDDWGTRIVTSNKGGWQGYGSSTKILCPACTAKYRDSNE